MINTRSASISKTVPFDETTYLNSADDRPPVLSYIYTLKDYYNTNFDYDFSKIFHVSVKKKKEFGIFMGTLPYKVISEQRYSEVPDIKRHKISLGLYSSGMYDTGETYSVTRTLPEITGKKVTISYAAATTNDQVTINSYGGLLKTPAYLVNVKPEVKLDDTVILSGPVMGLGASLSATTALTSPNMSTATKTTDITRWISYAVGIPALNYPGTQLVGQIDRMRVIEGTLHDSINAMDTRAGELLQNIAIEYFGQLNNTSRSIEGIMHVQLTKMPSIAFVSADADYDYLFGVPYSAPQMKGLGIDAIRIASSPMPIDGDLAQRKEFIKQRGLNSSYLEHKILENLLGIESISAVKALQIAAKNGVPIYTINKANINSLLPLLTLSSDDKAAIQNAVNANKEVTVSRDNVTYYDWTGVGYIVRDSNTGTGAYMISNEMGGGGTISNAMLLFMKQFGRFLLIQKNAVFLTGGDPYNDSESRSFWVWSGFEMDTFITCVKLTPILLSYGYSSMCMGQVDKEELIKRATDKNTWIFYYAGHGSPNSNPFLGVNWRPGHQEYVYPADITNADVKIVFLNGCNTAANNSFQSSFGVDGNYITGGITRKEAVIGWEGIADYNATSDFVYAFFLQLGQGKTVKEAHDAVGPIYQRGEYNPIFKVYPLGSEESGGSTKLVPLP